MSAAVDRIRRGTKHSMAKLTEAEVVEIRKIYARGGITQTELAESFGVVQSLISGIVNGRRWPHVDGPVAARKYPEAA